MGNIANQLRELGLVVLRRDRGGWPVLLRLGGRIHAGGAAGQPCVERLEGRRLLSAVNGPILFETHRDGNVELYSMNADGSNSVRLTNHPAADQFAAWSPDGTKIAFSTNRDGGDHEIYTMNADGSGVTRLTEASGTDFDPAWSPDGQRIVFDSTRAGGDREIYTMRADGSDVQRVTYSAGSDAGANWSPDGSKIAFQSNRDGNIEIYVMNADGTGQLNLSSHPAGDEFYPQWSPDGSRIAFYGTRDGNMDVFTMNADGTGVTRLTSHPAPDGGPAWSPDGAKIAFVSFRDGNPEIYTMNADGGDQMRITQNAAFDTLPNWAPAPAANQPPEAVDDTATTVQGNPVTIAVLANDTDPDGDALAVSAVTPPAGGTAVINADNSVTYTPSAGFSGFDSFTYSISDVRGGKATGTVSLTVLTLTQAIEGVISEIEDLDTGGVLTHGQATNLIAKLVAAISHLDQDQPEQAIHLLELFLDRRDVLPQPEQQQLVDDVMAVIAALQQP